MALVLDHKPAPLAVSMHQSYEQAVAFKNNIVWNKLGEVTVGEALEHWFATLSPLTEKNYRSGVRQLVDRGYLHTEMSLQAFALINTNHVVDLIKKESILGTETWSECTKQARAACFISFTRFLSRRTENMIKKAVPSREGTDKTFFRVHDKVETQAMTRAQWSVFLEALELINPRDCLIAKIVLQGGKRINEVLTLRVDQINWNENMITFAQSKTKGVRRDTFITYPKSIMESLKTYIGDRIGLVFVTKTGKKISVDQTEKTFERAGIVTNLPFKATPHTLRASAITYLKQQGFSDSDIMKISGHSSSAMIYAYDKSSMADNASRKVCLVQ